MIARLWHGFTLPSNAIKHAAYLKKELVPAYLGLPGNRGALLLVRSQVGCAEFLVVSLWESQASLEALTGDPDIEKPIASAEEHKHLLNPAQLVKHYEVVVSVSSGGPARKSLQARLLRLHQTSGNGTGGVGGCAIYP